MLQRRHLSTFEGLTEWSFFSPSDFSALCFCGVGVYLKGEKNFLINLLLFPFSLLACSIGHFLLLSNVNFLPIAAQIRTLLVF